MSGPNQHAGFNKVALGAAMLAGCLTMPGMVHAAMAADGSQGGRDLPSKKVEKQIIAAERAVAKAPQDATLRARLGQTYLAAGRFASAGTTFEDAVSLGDKTPSTALAMALSYIASGRNAEAVALLGQWGDAIPAGDHGLALALAGDPVQAITLLGDAIKRGENTPKIRQNLAYAYALAGHLPEARAIAAQDVPADKLDIRVSEWALAASVGSQQSRVAALLGAPVRNDPGRPAQLALAVSPDRPALAAADLPVPPASATTELPPLAARPAFAQSEPSPSATPAPEIADIAEVMRRYDAVRATRPTSQRKADHVAAPHERPEHKLAAAKPASARSGGTHMVQLGSFSTEAGARRAWTIFVSRDASLKARELRITQATVNGRQYFRVAAAGYQALEAHSKCSSVRGHGGDCLALAKPSVRYANVPGRGVAPLLARR
jgi:Flp pilus assembly protein TadD